jgi:SHAQKYF class myb-like DNA-binding protein
MEHRRMSESSSTSFDGMGGETNAGRWTKTEHELFLRGLEEFGKDWKQIGSLIKSRTVVQIRTHAQKYFLANKKHVNDGSASPLALQLASSMAKSSSNKKRNTTSTTGNTKAKHKKKRITEENEGIMDLDKIFDLVDTWSSESDEGTPTSVDELDFLKANQGLPSFPQPIKVDESVETEPIPPAPPLYNRARTGQLSSPLHFEPVQRQQLPEQPVQYQQPSYYQQVQVSQHLNLQLPVSSDHGRSAPSEQPLSSTVPLGLEIPAPELLELPNSFDPLPPSFESVLFGRWMDTMTAE